MNDFDRLGQLLLLSKGRRRSISAENPMGAKGKGGMAIPNSDNPDLPDSAAVVRLGQGWKVRPFLKPKTGETVILIDMDGPGIIQHTWMATEINWAGTGRACVPPDGSGRDRSSSTSTATMNSQRFAAQAQKTIFVAVMDFQRSIARRTWETRSSTQGRMDLQNGVCTDGPDDNSDWESPNRR